LTTQPQTTNDVAFGFVKSLAAELSIGRVELPSFPEIALRVRRVLSDANSSVDKVVRVVGSEPALAGRLLRIANSASINRSGKHVADLRTAINRMGYDMVRSASMSFAMAQMRNNEKLYVLTRVADHKELFGAPATLNKIVSDWHTQIGKAILENWEFSDAMVQAVADQNDFDRVAEAADLSDVVAVAILMASFAADPDGLIAALAELPVTVRLGLDAPRTLSILKDFEAEIGALRTALSV